MMKRHMGFTIVELLTVVVERRGEEMRVYR